MPDNYKFAPRISRGSRYMDGGAKPRKTPDPVFHDDGGVSERINQALESIIIPVGSDVLTLNIGKYNEAKSESLDFSLAPAANQKQTPDEKTIDELHENQGRLSKIKKPNNEVKAELENIQRAIELTNKRIQESDQKSLSERTEKLGRISELLKAKGYSISPLSENADPDELDPKTAYLDLTPPSGRTKEDIRTDLNEAVKSVGVDFAAMVADVKPKKGGPTV